MRDSASEPFTGLTPQWAERVADQFARFAPATVSALDDLWVSDSSTVLSASRLRTFR